MSDAVWLLLGLLVLSYLGGILVGGRTIRGFGLPSGVEYLLFGFVLGARVLGVVGGALVAAFEPVLLVGSAWLAFVAGIGFLHVGRRPVKARRVLFGIGLTTFVAAFVAAAIWFALRMLTELTSADRLLLSLSVAAVSSETTRHSVRWVVERHGAHGALSDLLADQSRASVVVPALLTAVIFALAPGPELPISPLLGRVGVAVGIGVVLGLVATILLGREFRRDESWGILLGTSLFAVGVAMRLGQSGIAATFFMGLTIALVSPHRLELKAMVAPTEKPVMLPIAVLAGASVVPSGTITLLVIGVALAARLLIEPVRGAALSLGVRSARHAGPLLGVGSIATGAFTLATAVSLELGLPDALGPAVLACAAASLVIGELLGPLMLRRALQRTGEIASDSPISGGPDGPRLAEPR